MILLVFATAATPQLQNILLQLLSVDGSTKLIVRGDIVSRRNIYHYINFFFHISVYTHVEV